jgi:prepilin-type N-terminal cleavage/methylation domain-containing protein
VRPKFERGFSIVELLFAVAIAGVIALMALPSALRSGEDLRLKNDGRAIAQAVGVTKMRAAAKFTRARLFVDRDAEIFYTQYLDKTTGNWITEGAQTRLSTGIDFGWGPTIGNPPPNTQPALAQSNACTTSAGAAIANTSCIVFNSRGIPIDPVTASPLGGNAIYLTDGVGVFATTLTATPLIRLWWSPSNVEAWVQQ